MSFHVAGWREIWDHSMKACQQIIGHCIEQLAWRLSHARLIDYPIRVLFSRVHHPKIATRLDTDSNKVDGLYLGTFSNSYKMISESKARP